MKITLPELNFNNPISETKLDEVLALLEINEEDIIIDIGGGNGAVLHKMTTPNNANGVLIEIDEQLIEACKQKQDALIKKGKLKIVNADAKQYVAGLKMKSVDCFVCIGASHAFGGYVKLVKSIVPYLKDDGFLLAGEEFWAKTPTKEYLDILGAVISESRFHYENIELPEKFGLTYLYSAVASIDDWNRFEGKYFLEEEMKAAKLSKNEKQKALKNLRAFRNAQFKYGRAEMGFGLYLFKKEA